MEQTILNEDQNLSELEHIDLINAKELIDLGKFDDALQLLNDFSENSAITPKAQISYYILLCSIFIRLGKKVELLDYIKKACKAIQGQKISSQLVDIYYIKAMSYIWEFKDDEAFNLILKCEKLYTSFTQEPLSVNLKKKADIAWIKALLYSRKGLVDKALDCSEQALKLRKELDLKADIAISLSLLKEIYHTEGEFDRALDYASQCLKYAKAIDFKKQIEFCYITTGLIYSERGELEIAIDYHLKALAIAEEIDDKFGIAASLNNLGFTYFKQGRLKLAQDNLVRSLKLFKEFGSPGFSSIDLLFHIAIDQSDFEQANEYLEQLKQLIDQFDIKEISLWYRVDKAILLKTSKRAIHRGKAEEMLKEIVEENITLYNVVILALLHLSDLLLNELQTIGDIEIIDELKPYIHKLQNFAEKNHSYSIQAEAYILQARLALVTLELKEARQFLTKAQEIAEKYHLDRLALKISNEHDDLLKKLSNWEEVRDSNVSLAERMKIARLNEQMDHMLHRRAVEPLEIPDEDPVVVLIVSESGEPIFSYLFDEDWNFEDHLIGGFLTAINSFSDEMFAQGLDRATFGEYNLFMKPVSPYLVCYLYKGPSYLAKQRTELFIKLIQKDNDVWDTFKKFLMTSQLVQIKDIPSIKPLIKDIFIEKSIQLDVFESKTN